MLTEPVPDSLKFWLFGFAIVLIGTLAYFVLKQAESSYVVNDYNSQVIYHTLNDPGGQLNSH